MPNKNATNIIFKVFGTTRPQTCDISPPLEVDALPFDPPSTVLGGGTDVTFSTYPNMAQYFIKVYWLVFALHRDRVEAVPAILELDNVPHRVSHCQVIMRTQVLQRLHRMVNKNTDKVNFLTRKLELII